MIILFLYSVFVILGATQLSGDSYIESHFRIHDDQYQWYCEDEKTSDSIRDYFFNSREKSFTKGDVKSSSTNGIQLDSIYEYTFISETDSLHIRKSYYLYDEDMNNIKKTRYKWENESSLWQGMYKREYEYDENGNEKTYRYYTWDTESVSWGKHHKIHHEYNVAGLIVSSIRYSWDGEYEIWIEHAKMEYEYNEAGSLTIYTFHLWNSNSNVWLSSSRIESIYDENENIIVETTHGWNSQSETWVQSRKIEFDYTLNGNLTERRSYNWDAQMENWTISNKFEYNYDEFGNMITSKYFTWNSENEIWLGVFKVQMQYDEYGNLSARTQFLWDNMENTWVEDLKFQYNYDENGFNILFVSYTWDSNNQDWMKSHKYIYDYDEFGNVNLYSSHKWENEDGTWVLQDKIFYFYSIRTFMVSVQVKPEESGIILGQGTYLWNEIVTLESQNNDGYTFLYWMIDESIVSDQSIYTFNMPAESLVLTAVFSESTGVIQIETTKEKISVFPNPTYSNITINSNQDIIAVKILSGNGKLLNTISIHQNQASVNLSHLKPGVYFLKIVTSEGINTKRIQLIR